MKSFFPIYSLSQGVSTSSSTDEIFLNIYGEFLEYCYKQYYNTLIDIDTRSIYDLYKMGNIAYIEYLNNICQKYNLNIKLIHNHAFDIFKGDANNARVYIIYDNIKIGHFIIYNHDYYVKDFNYNKLMQNITLHIDFTQFIEFNSSQINPKDNFFIFNSGLEQNTVKMFIAILCGFSNISDFLRYYKIRLIAAKNIKLFVKNKIVKNTNFTYNIIYNVDAFTIFITIDNKIYMGEYSYNNYIQSLILFNDALLKKIGLC